MQRPLHRETVGDGREIGCKTSKLRGITIRQKHRAHKKPAGIKIAKLRGLGYKGLSPAQKTRYGGDDADRIGTGDQ